MKFSVVFGSQARGDFSEKSDFDMLLVNMDGVFQASCHHFLFKQPPLSAVAFVLPGSV